MNEGDVRPNTFLIGAQKSATTSLYNWVAQHPEVCGPSSLKDFPFFSRDTFFEKGIGSLQDAYKEEGCAGESIVMQGCVQYMYYPAAIERIYGFDSNAKILVVLRNPVDRAISAYEYFKKMKLETLNFNEAIDRESERMESGDIQVKSGLTYRSHGLYGKQMEHVYRFFPKKQVMVIKYEEVQNNPSQVVKKVYEFLGVDKGYEPEYNLLNKTGSVKSSLVQTLFFKQSNIRKALVNIIDPILPLHRRTKIRWAINEWNTKESKADKEDFEFEKKQLYNYYIEDIKLLEKVTGIDFNEWKKEN